MSTPPVPQHCPDPRELDDLELLTSGAAGPIVGFNEPGSPITLELPDALRRHLADGGQVELVDPEGLPLARLTEGLRGLDVAPLAHAQFGPFRHLHLRPEVARERYAGRTVVPVVDLVTDTQLDRLRELGPVLLAALVGAGTPALSPVGLLRGTLRVAELIDAEVIAVPLTHHDSPGDDALRAGVLAWYAGADPVVELEPGGAVLPALADIAAHENPAPADQGLVLFFTGLSGSGKSTLARALIDRVLEQGRRHVTSLDGDVVRRHLSAGLTFSKEDRETNIRRIGWVAAEIARHGGLAVCSPIAPFAETRAQVRAMVEQAGGRFFLVHVATPLEECERRDRKGLYAKARRGEIPEFTGISSPYEEPDDADVVVDTTGRSIDDALQDVVRALAASGHLDLGGDSAPTPASQARAPQRRTPRPAAAPAPTPVAPTPPPAEAAPRPTLTVADPPGPLRVLFVCTANICRSPYMELRAREIAGEQDAVEFISAGTHGFRSHRVDTTIAEVLRERGVAEASIESFASRRLTRELIEDADLVLTAEAEHRAYVLEEVPTAFRKAFTLGQFAASVSRVDDDVTGAALLRAVGHRRAGASPEHDVADPYRRGRAAAQEAGDQIDGLLQAVLPRLVGERS
ncbi:adenylyl-sulfate kinase [Nocardioides sp.]|uniref:adenylyl-sulfate kinase n=1 Tax=Nocardioides sp. TaxID=35761 RepID=UPI00351283E1